MSPLGLLIIVTVILLVCVGLLVFNHLVGKKMMNAQSGVVVHVEKWKEKPVEEKKEEPPVEVETPAPKKRERTNMEIKPPEVVETPPVEKNHKAEVRKRLRKNMMKSQIWNRIWS